MSLVPQILLDGARFLKIDKHKRSNDNLTVELRVDPHAHILYWRYEDAKVFTERELKGNNNYVYLQDICDVRLGKQHGLHSASFIVNSAQKEEAVYKTNLLTIVCGTDFVRLNFCQFVYLQRDNSGLEEFAKAIFDVSLKSRRGEHGILYHVRKKMAPKLYAALVPRFSEEEVKSALDANGGQISKSCLAELRKILPANEMRNVDVDDATLAKIVLMLTKAKTSKADAIFKRICDGENSISREKFGRFLRKSQHDHRLNDARYAQMEDDDVDEILAKAGCPRGTPITSSTFSQYLFGDSALAASSFRLRRDESCLRRPFNEFFIHSSHNTYCSGNQMVLAKGSARADVEMYKQSLLAGVRCVELDCWNGKDEPVITHGPTYIMRVNEISLRDVCEGIMESAFKTSPYPVILSIENHLNKSQQKKMVEIFKEVFGDHLLTQPLPNCPLTCPEGDYDVTYPLVSDLKYKIIVKAKRKIKKDEWKTRKQSETSVDELHYDTNSLDHEALKELSEEQLREQLEPSPEERTTSALSQVVNYMQAERITFNPEKKHVVCSVNETFAWWCLQNQKLDSLMHFSKNKLLRVYPKQTRIDSSNYNPMMHWLCGAQMVALNVQTNCNASQINFAMFERNGFSGYVPKPDFLLRPEGIKLKPYVEIPYTTAYTVEVEVISAYFLSTMENEKYHGKSFVHCELIDVPDELVKTSSPRIYDIRRRWRRSKESHFVTNYDSEFFVFEKVTLGSLSLLKFVVYADQATPIAQRILHIESMNNGFRMVTLRAISNRCLGPASLFVRFNIYMHVDGKERSKHKNIYNPFAFEREDANMSQQFSDPFNTVEPPETLHESESFELVDGTRRGSLQMPTTPTSFVPKAQSFASKVADFFRKK